jgi:hypothetical protein
MYRERVGYAIHEVLDGMYVIGTGANERKGDLGKCSLRWELFMTRVFTFGIAVCTAVTMKNAVVCDVTPCRSCKNQRFGGKFASYKRHTA